VKVNNGGAMAGSRSADSRQPPARPPILSHSVHNEHGAVRVPYDGASHSAENRFANRPAPETTHDEQIGTEVINGL
jgi:hypothetical protein